MTNINECQIPQQQSQATVQNGLMGHLKQPGPEHHRLAVFSEGGNTQMVCHERLDDAGNWQASMDVTLRKIQ